MLVLPDVPTKLPADILPLPVKLPAPSKVQVYAPLTISTLVPAPTKLPTVILPLATDILPAVTLALTEMLPNDALPL